MNKFLIISLACLAISGCFKEGTPEITNPESIVINGNKYTPTEYIQEFCVFEAWENDKNCRVAARQQKIDRARR